MSPIDGLPDALSPARPKGTQLRRILEELTVQLGPGGRLPSERTMAQRFGVARMTIRSEMDRLVQAGMVERAHGRGTFVAQPKVAKTQRLLSFSAEMRTRGLTPGAEVITVEVVPASAAVGLALGLAQGTSVVAIERVRTADGRPMALERACLPAARFDGLAEVDLADRSLYDTLERRWGVVPDTAEQRVAAVALADDEAERLMVEPRTPALLFHRTTRDVDGAVFEHTRSLYRADRYDVAFEVTSVQEGTARTTPFSRRRGAAASPTGPSAARRSGAPGPRVR